MMEKIQNLLKDKRAAGIGILVVAVLFVLVGITAGIAGCTHNTVKESTATDAIREGSASDAGKETETEKLTDETTKEETTPEETATAQEETTTTEAATAEEGTTETGAFSQVSKTVYAAQGVNVRSAADSDSEKLGRLSLNDAVEVTGYDGEWYRIIYNGTPAYVWAEYFTDTETPTEEQTQEPQTQQLQTQAVAQEPQIQAQTTPATVQESQTSAATAAASVDEHGHTLVSSLDLSGFPYTDPQYIVNCGDTLQLYQWCTYNGIPGFFGTADAEDQLWETNDEGVWYGDIIAERHGVDFTNCTGCFTEYCIDGNQGNGVYFYAFPDSVAGFSNNPFWQYVGLRNGYDTGNFAGKISVHITGTFSPYL